RARRTRSERPPLPGHAGRDAARPGARPPDVAGRAAHARPVPPGDGRRAPVDLPARGRARLRTDRPPPLSSPLGGRWATEGGAWAPGSDGSRPASRRGHGSTTRAWAIYAQIAGARHVRVGRPPRRRRPVRTVARSRRRRRRGRPPAFPERVGPPVDRTEG